MLEMVDQKGRVIGQAKRDNFHHNPNLIHRVVHCWIFNRKGQILWQQRSLSKKKYPGYWDISCAGHVGLGETPKQTLQRELKEELGLQRIKFYFVEKYLSCQENETELIYLYYAVIDQDLGLLCLQKEEVAKAGWFDLDKAQTMALKKEVLATDWIITQLPKILQKIFGKFQRELKT